MLLDSLLENKESDEPLDFYTMENKNMKLNFNLKDIIKLNENNFKNRYYSYYGIYDINKACENYIDGLYWTFGYYNNHIHDNWSWYYKYDQVPLASDLYNYLLIQKEHFDDKCNKQYICATLPVSQLEQLLMVLPKGSLLNTLESIDSDGKFKRILQTHSEELNKYYPENLCIDLINKEYLWQSKIFFHSIDYNFIKLITSDF